MRIEGQIAIVAGSTGRLGAELAMALASRGCDCVCHYNRNRQLADELVGKIESLGRRALAVGADFTDAGQISAMFEQIKAFGTASILINSAAVFERKALSEITLEDARRTLDINLSGIVMVKVVPFPTVLSTEMDPSWASTIRLQMARPNPIPLALVVKRGVHIFSLISSGIPSPVSVKVNSTLSLSS